MCVLTAVDIWLLLISLQSALSVEEPPHRLWAQAPRCPGTVSEAGITTVLLLPCFTNEFTPYGKWMYLFYVAPHLKKSGGDVH